MWFSDHVDRNGLSIGEWRKDEVVVTTPNVFRQMGNATWYTVGEELIRLPLSLIESDIDEAKERVDYAIRLENCFGL
jgi:hypothetical protein